MKPDLLLLQPMLGRTEEALAALCEVHRLAAIGWAVISDTSPKEATALCGGIFNAIGNIAGIVTPITIGYILQVTGSFNGALWFVAAHCLIAMFSYLVVVGKIHRVALRPAQTVVGATALAG
jgi:nitrate/nitrite transporter NarK